MTAKETIYDGVIYRSRLEATWAAMFDLMGWPAIYEPVMLGKYIPDFEIGYSSRSYYVEIKPRKTFLQNRSEILRKASGALKRKPLLILTDEFWDCSADTELAVGYIYGGYGDDSEDEVRLWYNGERWDFFGCWGGWDLRLSGEYDGNALAESGIVPAKTVTRMWSQALNRTRWKATA